METRGARNQKVKKGMSGCIQVPNFHTEVHQVCLSCWGYWSLKKAMCMLLCFPFGMIAPHVPSAEGVINSNGCDGFCRGVAS